MNFGKVIARTAPESSTRGIVIGFVGVIQLRDAFNPLNGFLYVLYVLGVQYSEQPIRYVPNQVQGYSLLSPVAKHLLYTSKFTCFLL